jgi:hypothetical protein
MIGGSERGRFDAERNENVNGWRCGGEVGNSVGAR